jgi:dihydrofolate reductase
MIRCIVAIDSKNGLANETGIPWNLPSDKAYFRNQTNGGIVLMGYDTYRKFNKPLVERKNLVVVREGTVLSPGFEHVTNTVEYLRKTTDDIWIIGGSKLFESTVYLADELFITQIDGDFNCTKFFPDYTGIFRQVDTEEPHLENDITYTFTHWKRTTHLLHKQR